MKAIISGASKGIGRATAIALAKEGYDLILLSRSESALNELKNYINSELKEDVKIEIKAIDLSSKEEVDQLQLNIHEKDQLLLVNNVGGYQNEDILRLKREEVEKMLSVNLFGSIALSEKCLPYIQKAKQSQIVNISSINGLNADANATAYSISKHALKAWNDALREELRTKGVKVTAFYPGPVNTTSWEGVDVEHAAMIQAEDIAKLIVQLGKLSEGALVEEIKITPLNFKMS